LNEARLPADSVILFKTPSVWSLYKRYIVAGALLLLLQSALIVGLWTSHARLRRAQRARIESEKRRQLAEEQAQRQRDELAHALRLTTLGELTASFAHQLGQPLTAIIANARAAKRMLAADRVGSGDAAGALDDIATAASDAAETIQRLRALFRKEHTQRIPVDVNALIDDVLRLLKSDIIARRIEVRFTHDERIPTVLGDPVQLRQVVMNLLVNAEDAISLAAGGPREIHIRAGAADAERVAIAVTDSGVGLEDSELERIFEHFVSSKPQGLGMGLAISRSIVEAHGGRIWAVRNTGRGITLNVELPTGGGARQELGA
jgi:signal transduction histidine kinase